VSGTVPLVVTPNATPTLGGYPDVAIPRGSTIASAPASAVADANGNLSPTPYSLTPATLPGGGTVAINQSTGVVTVTTTNATALETTLVRVTALDSCGAATISSFNISVCSNCGAAPVITSQPPPAPVIVGTFYTHTFTASGSPAPTFGLTSGILPSGLSLSPAGLLSGTPTDAGTGSFQDLTVTASNGNAPAAQQTFSLSAVTRVGNYLASFGLTGGDAAFIFDFDGDGVSNGLEYALRLDPTVSSTAGLPVVTVKDYGGTKYLSMTFTRFSVATDLSYVVQGSSDLAIWTDLATSSGGEVTSGPGFVSEIGPAPAFAVEVRDTEPIEPGGAPRRFLRLRVTSP
ncbi:MAG: Ig domain-containing protein, partial [Verrucomicrobiota bacterium]|nr:Ig domain-containing protein [Verrucomicrobiota bacterium]